MAVLQARVSLCIPGSPETQAVDQAVLELRDLPPSAGRKACATTNQLLL